MDGKPLYEYARSGTALPRPIPSRKVTVHSLKLLSFKAGDQHEYEWPKESLDDSAKKELEKLEKMVKEGSTVVPKDEEVEVDTSASDEKAQALDESECYSECRNATECSYRSVLCSSRRGRNAQRASTNIRNLFDSFIRDICAIHRP